MNEKANLEVAPKELEDPKDIAREMLKEEKPMEEITRVTGLNEKQIWGIKGGLTRAAKKEEKAEAEEEIEEGVGGGLTEKDIKDMSPREIVSFYGSRGLDFLKEKRLRQFLSVAPKVGTKARKWIMNQWGIDETLHDDPDRLYQILTESGVEERLAFRIINGIVALEDEYAPLLEQRRPFVRRRTRYPPSTPYWPERPATREGYPRWGSRYRRPSRYGYEEEPMYEGREPRYTRDDLERVRREERTSRRIEKVEEKTTDVARSIEKMTEDLPRIIKESLPREETTVQYVTEEIPVDAKGNPVHPDKAVTIKRIRKPVEEKRETLRDTLKEFRDLDIIITPDKMKEIIKEAKPSGPPAKSEELIKLEAEVEAQRKALATLKEEREKERFDALSAEIDRSHAAIADLRDEMRTRPRGAYGADEYRYLDTLTREVASRRPLEVVVDFGRELALPGGGTPQRPAAKGGRGRIIKSLRERGLVVPE